MLFAANPRLESPADEETEVQEQTAEIPVFEAPSSSVANTVLIASLVLLASGIAGGIAFVIQMQFPHLRDVTGVIGGCAIAGVGVALARLAGPLRPRPDI